jgi:hypothetical protein
MKTSSEIASLFRRFVPQWDAAHALLKERLSDHYASAYSAEGLPLTNDAARSLARAITCVEAGVTFSRSLDFSWTAGSIVTVADNGNALLYLPVIQPLGIRPKVTSGFSDWEAGRCETLPPRYHGAVLDRVSRLLRRVVSLADKHAVMGSSVADGLRAYRERCHSQPVPQTLMQRMAARPLNPDTFRYTRAVGMEFEGFAPIGAPDLAARLPVWSRVAQDGSIRPVSGTVAHEVRALFPREMLEVRLHRLLTVLGSVGFRVNASCGLHVHFDMRGRSEDHVMDRARMVDKWLYALRELVPASRRDGNNYCKFGVSKADRYRAVNVRAFASHSTLEIRLHSGTVDYTKVLAWLRLCELLLAMRRKPTAADCLGTLAQLPLAEHDVAYWRERHRTLNPGVYSGSAVSSEIES